MYTNVGGKIKGLAKTVAIIGIIISVLLGLAIIGSASSYAFGESLLLGIIIIAAGTFISWLSTLTMYGFGQIIENTDKLVAAQNNQTNQIKANVTVDSNWVCPACNTANNSAASFCKNCGNKKQ